MDIKFITCGVKVCNMDWGQAHLGKVAPNDTDNLRNIDVRL